MSTTETVSVDKKNELQATNLGAPRKPKAKAAKGKAKVVTAKAAGKKAAKVAKPAKAAKSAKVAKPAKAAKAAGKKAAGPKRTRSEVPTTKAQGNVPVKLFQIMLKDAKAKNVTPAAIVKAALVKFYKFEE